MNLTEAQKISEEFIEKLRPYCLRVEVAGSIRRKKPDQIKDIDILCIYKDYEEIKNFVESLGKVKVSGKSKIQVETEKAVLDVYFATEDDWGSQILYLTGNNKQNVKMRSLAKNKFGWKLNQHGLFDGSGDLISSDEKGIFEMLELNYKEPWEREKR